jgi:hypothetical protein
VKVDSVDGRRLRVSTHWLVRPRRGRKLFLSLDFLYMPSADPAVEVAQLERAVGAEIVFTIEAFGARVAMVRLGNDSPALLFADHLQGERPILVYRVADLPAAMTKLREAGFDVSEEFGIPPGPCAELITAGRHRLAVYESTRPEVLARLEGRRDF